VARKGLVLQVCPRRPAGVAAPRVGFTASRKVGGAVERNRARRRLRAAVDRIMPAHAVPETDYVVIARMATLSRDFPGLLADLESAMRALDAWQGNGATAEAGE